MWIVLLLIIVGIAATILFVPQLKGWRTVILQASAGILGAVVPVLSQWVTFLQGLDWREYILSGDKKNLYILGIVAVLSLVGLFLRLKTDGPVGDK